MKKTYPKVPRHDHPVVEDEFFEADDLVLLEKADGSNFRACLYDERYSDMYGEQTEAQNPSDGDILVGTKGTVRGCVSEPVDSFDGAFKRIIPELRESIDTNRLREFHSQYDSPLVLFGEHMVRHTIDYGYDENPPPAFIGFDVFVLSEYEHPPSNPFDETFGGFLSLEDAFDVFESVGLATMNIVEKVDGSITPDNITIPISSYGSVRSEGVVIRSDSQEYRVKYVSDHFKEQHKVAWGMREDEATSGEELFAARYLTNPRIRKQIHKLAYRTNSDNIDVSTVTNAVVADAWEEELEEIQTINTPFTPTHLYDIAQARVEAVFETMRTNAALNDTSLDSLWESVSDGKMHDTEISTFTVETEELTNFVETIDKYEDVHEGIVKTLIPEAKIHRTAEDIADREDKEFGKWLIRPTYDELLDDIWYGEVAMISNLPVEITPEEIGRTLMPYVRNEIELQVETGDANSTDVEIDTSGFDEMF